jgi:hypothetical protein
MPERLAAVGDLWADLNKRRRSLREAAKRLERMRS